MRFITTSRMSAARRAAVDKYNRAHPCRTTRWRRAKREKEETPNSTRGHPRKKVCNLYRDLPKRNRALLTKLDIKFNLWDDDSANFDFQLRHSGIHGLGVASIEQIEAGATLMNYAGELIDEAEANLREVQYRRNGVDIYLFEVVPGAGTIIDASSNGNLARFINHSCDPNCIALPSDDGQSIRIVAGRNLKKFDEITYDYGLTEGEPIACNCNSQNCRKFL